MGDNLVDRVLRGLTDNLPPQTSKVVRIFLSSTFTDTVEERNALMEKAYPQLKDYCKKKYGLDFQVVDMRWGIRDEATDDHRTSDICMQEIENCQRLSLGPNFVTLLGQRHGSRLSPSTIPCHQYDAIRGALLQEDAQSDAKLMDSLYAKDENAIPPIYVLKPISSHFPDFLSQDLQKKTEARSNWNAAHVQLLSMLHKASTRCLETGQMTEQDAQRYSMSVTEYEIHRGVLSMPQNASEHCLGFVRIIEDMVDHLDHPLAWRFIDMEGEKVDEDAQFRLKQLRDEKLIFALKNMNLYRWSTIRWNSNGGINRDAHNKYLEEMTTKFQQSVTFLIDQAVSKIQSLHSNTLYTEVLQHLQMAQKRCTVFQGRDELLSKVRSAIEKAASTPVVIHGPSGSGKTSVMAVAASKILTWFSGSKDPVIISRFLGTTPASSTIHRTLRSISEQIRWNYTENRGKLSGTQDIPSDYSELVGFFHDCLNYATPKKPLFLFFDSLDQLAPANNPYKLSWLPLHIPAHCKIVLSTLPSLHGILDNLKHRVHDEQITQVDTLGEALGVNILSEWLRNKGRTLTSGQLDRVKEAFSKLSLPLYVKLVFDKAMHWNSYQPEANSILPSTVKQVINDMFTNLEMKHGKLLVCHAMAYLCASRDGLSESEMEDLLSLDEDVLTDVFQYHVPPVRRVPPLLWVRIRQDLAEYLVTRDTDGSDVVFWYHRQFIETASNKYLSSDSFAKTTHSALADFFSGLWFRKEKPFQYTPYHVKKMGLSSSSAKADRKVVSQPLFYEIEAQRNGPVQRRFNLRKLNNVPYHLHNAGRYLELRRTCLFDYSWLYNKLQATSVQVLMADLDFISGDKEATLLKDSLNLARSTLRTTPETLAIEIVGQLAPFCSPDYPWLTKLMDQCYDHGYSENALLPRAACYSSPGGALTRTLEHAHANVLEKIIFLSADSKELFMVSGQNEMIVWDIAHGEIDRIFPLLPQTEPAINVISFAPNGLVMLGCAFQKDTNPVVVFDRTKGEVVNTCYLEKIYTKIGFTENYQLFLAGDKLLVGILGKSLDVFSVPSGKLLTETGFQISACLLNHSSGLGMFGLPNNAIVVWDFKQSKPIQEISTTGIPQWIVGGKDESQALVICKGKTSIDVFKHQKRAGLSSVWDKVNGIDLSKHIKDGQCIYDVTLSNSRTNLLVALTHYLIIVSSDKLSVQRKIDLSEFVEVFSKIPAYFAQFSSDDKYVVCAYENFILVWDLVKSSNTRLIQVEASLKVNALLIACSSRFLITSCRRSKILKVWDWQKKDVQTKSSLHREYACRYMMVANERPTAVIRTYNPRGVFVVQLDKAEITHKLSTDSDVMGPTISGSGNYALLRGFSDERSLKVWDTRYGNLVNAFPVSSLYLKTFAISNDDDLLVTHCESSPTENVQIQLWKTSSGELIQEYSVKKGAGGFSYIFFALQNTLLIFLKQYPLTDEGRKCTVLILSLKTGATLTEFENVMRDSLHLHSDATHIFFVQCGETPSKDRLVTVKLADDGGEIIRQNKTIPVGRMHLSRDGTRAADVGIRVIDTVNDAVLCDFDNKKEKLMEKNPNIWPKISAEGKYLVWAIIMESVLKVAHIDRSEIIASCFIHGSPLSLVVFGLTGVAIGVDDGRIMILEIVDPTDENARQHADSIKSLCLTDKPQGQNNTKAVKSNTRRNQQSSATCDIL